MAIQNNFPNIRPSLALDFANTKTLDPRITFSRASSATYFDANGVLKTAPSGVARFDHDPRPTLSGTGTVSGSAITLPAAFADGAAPLARDDAYNGMAITVAGSPFTVTDYVGSTRVATLSGTPTTGSQAFTLQNPNMGESLGLLIEEQRTNLLIYSQEFDNAAWGKSRTTVIANATTAPDGTLTADTLVEDTSESLSHGMASQNISCTSGVTYSFSVYAKQASGARYLQIIFLSAVFGSNLRATFDLSNGTFVTNGGTATIERHGDYYRCIFAATATATAAASVNLNLANTYAATLAAITYTGDGTSGIYIWGAQLEAGSHPTSYIKTEGAQATRNADVASMTGANFSSWYRQDEGTFFVSSDYSLVVGGNYRFDVTDGTSSNQMRLRSAPSGSTQSRFELTTSGVAQTTLSPATTNPVLNKDAIAYKLDDGSAVVNAETVVIDTSLTPATMNQMAIGSTRLGAGVFNGHISRITYYPKRLTDAQLQALTA